jgi:hypothetical protein
MNKLARLAGALALCAAAVFAGDCMSGTDCANCCPLAKQANERVANGNEALAVSTTLRGSYVKTILANLETI